MTTQIDVTIGQDRGCSSTYIVRLLRSLRLSKFALWFHNTVLEYVLDRPKGSLAHLLRPNTIQSPNATFGKLTCNTPLSYKGVHGVSETGSNEPQRLSACSRNKLSGGYTSHDFVTARARCAITTALQPSTSINRGLIAVPKVESNSSSKPSLSDLYWLERRSACRYTPPVRSKKHSDVFHHRLNHCIQSTGSHLLVRYDQWRRLWEIYALPVFILLKTKAFQKITMAANGANSQIRSEIRIPQRDDMTSSPSPGDTPREEPVQIIPLQGPTRPTETLEDTMPAGALVGNLLHTVQRQTSLIEEQNWRLMDLEQAHPLVRVKHTPSPIRSRRGRSPR